MKHQRIVTFTIGLTISLLITILLWSVLSLSAPAEKQAVSDKYRGVNNILIEYDGEQEH